MKYQCTVCGYGELTKPAVNHSICPCCGTEFWTDDIKYTHEQLRIIWVDKGAPWFSRRTLAPTGWHALAQLIEAGFWPVTVTAKATVDMSANAGNHKEYYALAA